MKRVYRRRPELYGLGDRIVAARKERDLTQKELARIVGVSKTTILMAETAKRELGAMTLREVAKALRVSTDYLLNG